MLLFKLLLITTLNAQASNVAEQIAFLHDYYSNKNHMVTLNVCWRNFSADISLLKKLTKQISVHRNSNNLMDFFTHLTNNNHFVLDMDCENSFHLLQKANELSLFRYPLKYLLLINNNQMANLTYRLENYSIFPTSEVVIAEKLSSSFFNLHQPYRIDKESDIIWEYYGNWTAWDGLVEALKTTPITSRRYDLRKANFNVSFFIGNNDTWNHLDDLRYPRVDTFTKQVHPTMKALLDYINVNATWIQSTTWGYYDEKTKQWNGLIEDVAKGRSQISGAPVFYTKQRFQVVDFIKMQNPLEIRFILKKPPLSYTINIYYYAFRFSVWICIFIVTVLFGLTLYAILNFESTYKRLNNQNKFTISDVTLILLEAVCQQGTTTEPKSVSGRIIALILFTAFMFLYVSYSAYIVVLLQSTVKLTTIKELLESRMDAGGYNASYMRHYLSGAKDTVRKTLYEKKIGPDGYYSLDDGMSRVQRGFFALHVELGAAYNYVLEKFTDYEICGLQELEGFTEYFKGYTFVPKNSPYKEIFKIGLYRIDENGIQRRNLHRYYTKPKCFSKGGNFDSVGMIDCYVILLILFIGVFLSIFILIVEKVIYKIQILKEF